MISLIPIEGQHFEVGGLNLVCCYGYLFVYHNEELKCIREVGSRTHGELTFCYWYDEIEITEADIYKAWELIGYPV